MQSGLSNSLIAMENMGVQRGGRWLVRDVDLTIGAGEIVTLIGPNGSGKSTTAKTAIGIVEASAGTVRRAHDLVVGYVPQKLAVDRSLPLTVARLMRLTTRTSTVAMRQALERVGIPHLEKAEIHGLSGGEFQRALLARAMLRKPNLLVLDEPVQGVDFAGEIALYELISELRDQDGCAVLLISHDLHVVMAKTDRVLCLNGHVCCEGSPRSVAASPAYRQLFGDRAADALAIYRHKHDHTHLPDGQVVAANDAPGEGGGCSCTESDFDHHDLHPVAQRGAAEATATKETDNV
ncbi:ATP-binding cassette domain-containing protein [Jiella sp. MQZ9-1]|uniref:ATP-binding cassette domain-containing protein n=1 Tax=Jiella flava TaxID=2816857 RepID=A0A939G0F5_9HYPH|nr:ATP-binding cassette domain-containing protein [Jiella flava]MBO0662897.1 ATP-binding cassette domain-containing protein [Jiella flava]MCD2471343.1 ATP-binding cassette domain-containing protein [Jiella flava]